MEQAHHRQLWLGLPTRPEPSAMSSHSALKHGMLKRFSRVSIGEYVSCLVGCSSLRGRKTHIFSNKSTSQIGQMYMTRSNTAKNW